MLVDQRAAARGDDLVERDARLVNEDLVEAVAVFRPTPNDTVAGTFLSWSPCWAAAGIAVAPRHATVHTTDRSNWFMRILDSCWSADRAVR